VFGAALPRVQMYADALASTAIERGILGPAEAARVWDRHLLNCAPVAKLIAPDSSVVDIGSGAGLPGLVIALLRPDVDVTVLDAQARRCTFLTEMVEILDLGNRVMVVQGRAEDGLGGRRSDYVTVRAVAPVERLLPLCAGLLRSNGEILAIKGAGAAGEVTRAADALKRYDARAQICELALPEGAGTTTVVRVVVGRTNVGPKRHGQGRRSAGERKPG
jgi:16S rRNA (guanine527-N7)-methyltransferase